MHLMHYCRMRMRTTPLLLFTPALKHSQIKKSKEMHCRWCCQ